MLHLISTRCVACDLHMIAPGPHVGDNSQRSKEIVKKNLKLHLWMQLLLLFKVGKCWNRWGIGIYGLFEHVLLLCVLMFSSSFFFCQGVSMRNVTDIQVAEEEPKELLTRMIHVCLFCEGPTSSGCIEIVVVSIAFTVSFAAQNVYAELNRSKRKLMPWTKFKTYKFFFLPHLFNSLGQVRGERLKTPPLAYLPICNKLFYVPNQDTGKFDCFCFLT